MIRNLYHIKILRNEKTKLTNTKLSSYDVFKFREYEKDLESLCKEFYGIFHMYVYHVKTSKIYFKP